MHSSHNVPLAVIATVIVFVAGIITTNTLFMGDSQTGPDAAAVRSITPIKNTLTAPKSAEVISEPVLENLTPPIVSPEISSKNLESADSLKIFDRVRGVLSNAVTGLQFGDQSEQVLFLQRGLKKLGFLPQAVNFSQSFGPQTEKAVSILQLSQGIPVTGTVDRQTARLVVDTQLFPKDAYNGSTESNSQLTQCLQRGFEWCDRNKDIIRGPFQPGYRCFNPGTPPPGYTPGQPNFTEYDVSNQEYLECLRLNKAIVQKHLDRQLLACYADVIGGCSDNPYYNPSYYSSTSQE